MQYDKDAILQLLEASQGFLGFWAFRFWGPRVLVRSGFWSVTMGLGYGVGLLGIGFRVEDMHSEAPLGRSRTVSLLKLEGSGLDGLPPQQTPS